MTVTAKEKTVKEYTLTLSDDEVIAILKLTRMLSEDKCIEMGLKREEYLKIFDLNNKLTLS